MALPGNIVTKSAEETAKLGKKVADYVAKRQRGEKQARVICLYGDLGSGKTTFTRGFAKGLGIPTRLPSPTFLIVRRYSSARGIFFHIDLYRMKSKHDLEGLGIAELFRDPTTIIVIEWAGKLGKLLPAERIDVRFSVLENGIHRVSIQQRE